MSTSPVIRSGYKISHWGLSVKKKSIAVPFYKKFYHRIPTLSLYKSMLKAAKSFDNEIHKSFLISWIREGWRFHCHDTSPKSTMQNILQAEEFHAKILKALKGEPQEISHIDDLAWGRTGQLKKVMEKIKAKSEITSADPILFDTRTAASQRKNPSQVYAIPLPSHLLATLSVQPPKIKQARKPKPRKPYQVAYMVQDCTGVPFFRIRGYQQPLWLSMKIKERVKAAQRNIDSHDQLTELLQDVRIEQVFWKNLGLERQEWSGWDSVLSDHIRQMGEDYAKIKDKRLDGRRGREAFQELENTGF